MSNQPLPVNGFEILLLAFVSFGFGFFVAVVTL
jgi:hypothetical protein